MKVIDLAQAAARAARDTPNDEVRVVVVYNTPRGKRYYRGTLQVASTLGPSFCLIAEDGNARRDNLADQG